MKFPLPNINFKNPLHDISSGLIVALVSIPISMGYAQVAGLPAVYGLYGSLLPVLVYGIFASSPQFVIGVDAMPAAMTGASLASLGVVSGSAEAMKIVPAIALLVALWMFLFRILRMGRIVKYISNPVMGGFISGVGLTIILMQIPKLFGGNAGTGEILVLIPHIIEEFGNFNLLSCCLGFGTVIIIMIFKKFFPKFPMTVVMLFLGMIITALFKIDRFGVKLLSAVEPGLPEFMIPDLRVLLPHIQDYLILSLTIALVVMAQTLLAANSYAQKYDYKLNNNRELIAYGMMNVAGAVCGSCPINGSVSRTGIADQFGCKSQLMSVTAALTMLLVLLFCTKLFVYLPVPILTGIVMSALIGIIDFKQAVRLFKCNKVEFWIFIMAMLGVLFLGTIYGVVIGVILSFILVVRKAVVPPKAFLGKIPGHHGYYNLSRNKNSRPIQNTVIYRFGGNLFFANIGTFVSDIENSIKDDTKFVLVDAGGIGDIDITAADRLLALRNKIEAKNIKFYFTEHQGNVNDQLRLFGAGDLIEKGNVRRTISLALRDCGMEKPYPLEGIDESEKYHYVESDEKLAEFEWAFGKDAEEQMKKMAAEMAESVTSADENEITEFSIEQLESKIGWGKIGLFDEEALLENFEIILEQLVSKGKLDPEKLKELEKLIEKRKELVEYKVSLLNPKAKELLHRRMEEIEAHLKKANPKEFEHLKNFSEFLKKHKK